MVPAIIVRPARRVRPAALAALAAALLGAPSVVAAHPAPFSFLDVRLQAGAVDVTLVVHVFDAAYELKLEDPEPLLDAAMLARRSHELTNLLRARLTLEADGRALTQADWSAAEPVPSRQSLRLRARYATDDFPGHLAIDASLFPYDPQHQTFVNVYEYGELASQAILGRGRFTAEHFTGTRQGTLAVIKRFVPAGIHHILIGPDHLLFLVALLLLGGSVRRLALIVSAFTLAHSVTLSLAALGILNPPAAFIEPAIALSIVCVGADNLLVGGGPAATAGAESRRSSQASAAGGGARDLRGWMAFAFGFIHGFGFANVLREMQLPPGALGWSLFSFNLGVEIGQLLVVIVVASLLTALRSRSQTASRRLAVAGSLAVIAAGGFWFVQRVFFPGGLA
jgi:hydrogenase/urease accessory protein HupE